MTALLIVETVILAVLCVLVAGLLRGYATVLRRLHQLDGGAEAGPAPFRTIATIPEPAGAAPATRIEGRDEWASSHDIDGVSLRGEIVSVRTVGVEHDTILAFLSSHCEGCTGFWHELGEPGSWTTPLGSRLLVVTKGPEDESPSALSQLCPDGVDLVMSSQAWTDFEVPGSPYVVVADGRTGRVKGEGSGTSFSQVGGLIRQSVEDSRHPAMARKPDADRRRERDVDRILLSAGIGPQDPSLYADDRDERA
ncbi:MAG TPA: hypothetical protein VGX49_03800 [Jatrophihabitans sp.]|jgi:hypothetical protein|nr:hypothetical protein [Jatrophihabitans sp.]